MNAPRKLLAPFLLGLALGSAAACNAATSEEPPASPARPSLSWHRTPCGRGEPVEVPLSNPVEVASPEPKCADLASKEGDPCTEADKKCVVEPAMEGEFPAGSGQKRRMAASFMVCRAKPFDAQPCPRSLASVKKDIHYLSDAERAAIVADVRDLRVVRYRYKSEADDASPTVGFLIDDAPNASFVDTAEGRVNLYSYTTAMAVTLQHQDEELAVLRSASRTSNGAPPLRRPRSSRTLRHFHVRPLHDDAFFCPPPHLRLAGRSARLHELTFSPSATVFDKLKHLHASLPFQQIADVQLPVTGLSLSRELPTMYRSNHVQVQLPVSVSVAQLFTRQSHTVVCPSPLMS